MTPEALELLTEILRDIPPLPDAVCRDWPLVFEATTTVITKALTKNRDERRELREMRAYAVATAERLCQSCPALDACRTWVQSLPPAERPPGIVAGQTHTRRPSSTNQEEPPMTDTDRPEPNYRDIERGLRISLARRLGDDDVLPLLAAECIEPADVDMLIVALADALNHVLDRGAEDPEKFLADWITNVRERAESEGGADDGAA